MSAQQKADELIEKYGKQTALEIANMILHEHFQYSDSYATWYGEFREIYINAELCNYWDEVRIFIKNET